jgi:endonuclease YncB( thermonuclease family)
MNPLRSKALRLLLIAALALATSTARAETFAGRVTGIVDGDSLILADTQNRQRRIRLDGIDAPEILQAFGQNAKTALSAMVFGQPATANCIRRDRQGNEWCILVVAGKDVGLELLGNGMAWWDRRNSGRQTRQERSAYEQAEFLAKIHRFGLWNSKNPQPPWEWRRKMADE